ncbi:MAG: serine hydrolase [Planctomycetota bacterium]
MKKLSTALVIFCFAASIGGAFLPGERADRGPVEDSPSSGSEAPTISFVNVISVDEDFETAIRPLLVQYCADCHAAGEMEDLDFLSAVTTEEAEGLRDVYAKVLTTLVERTMPPGDFDQPAEAERKLVVEWIRSELDLADVASLPVFEPEEYEDADHFVEEMDKKIPGLLQDFSVPGTAIAIIEDGEVILQKGYGLSDVESSDEVDLQTGFNIGSISKTVAAWGVMKLVQEGRIDLDAPVEQYLTRWHLPPSAFDSSEVTIRRLLSHTAGLSLHGYPGWTPADQLPTVEESLNGVNNGPGSVQIILEPGTEYKYSGGGYTILQLVIEEVTGRKFEDYMQSEILDPLGMTASSYRIDDRIMASSASEYDAFGEQTDFELFTAQAAAGLHTTIEDFTRFALANLHGIEDFENYNSVLPAVTVEQMMQPVPQAAGRYGYGLAYFTESIPGTDVVLKGHRGSNTGWQAIFLVNPETNDGFVMVTNGGSGQKVYYHVYSEWVRWKTGAVLEDWHRAKPSIANRLKAAIDENGIENVEAAYANLVAGNPDRFDVSEDQLNQLGYYFLGKEETEAACSIFGLNARLFPDSFNVYDSYGEALLKQGDKAAAIENYLKSVRLNPQNENGLGVLSELGVSTAELIAWGPMQATGKPDTPMAGDLPTSWCTVEPDAGHEWLRLTYDRSVDVSMVRVYETYNPGAVTSVTAKVEDGEIEIWSGEPEAGDAPRWLELAATNEVKTQTITIHLDTTLQEGWNEIDAVELIGKDGSRQWATSAESSSFFVDGEPRDLQPGSSGPGVIALQEALNEFLVPDPEIEVDGVYGAETEGAVRQLQYGAEISVDGIAGHQTVAALVDLGADLDPYFRESSRAYDGAGPRVITRNVLQDSNGNFWLATWHGVMRYDGRTFTNVTNEAGLKRFRAFSLLEDDQKNIWLGTTGAGLYCYDGATFTNFTTEDGLVADGILSMKQDRAGNLWFGGAGATKFDGTRFTAFDEDDGFTSADVASISEAPDGKIWFGSRGALFHFDGETFVNFTAEHELDIDSNSYIPTLIDRKGHLWFGGVSGLFHYDGERIRHVFEPTCHSLFEDSKGNIWFTGGTIRGEDKSGDTAGSVLNRFDPETGLENMLEMSEQFKIQNGMIFGLSEDRDGNIWFGTGSGVGRISGGLIQYF